MSLKAPKKVLAQTLLLGPDAPRVFSPGSLMEWLEHKKCPLPRRSLTQALIEWNATQVVSKINAHVYLNSSKSPTPRPDEAASWLRPSAVVSLSRVLGDCGVLNNPTHTITCVMPLSTSRKSGQVHLGGNTFLFAALPTHMCSSLSSDEEAQDLFNPDTSYLQATPEKALMDWVYLNSTSAKQNHPFPPTQDWDFDLLDQDRLNRLVKKFNLQDEWGKFVRRFDLQAPKTSSAPHF